jgi:hypothetical protein
LGQARCQKWGAPILEAPTGRRDDFVDPYFKHAKKDEVVVILKAREPARIMIAIGSEDRWHLQLAQRWIVQYNFYNQRPALGSDVHTNQSLSALFSTRLPQSTPLAG